MSRGDFVALVGRIFDLQPFSLNDGPGTRTTVFLQGCSLGCHWCHNPESRPRGGALLFYPARCIACGACAVACPHAEGGASARHTRRCRLCGACASACYADAIGKAGREISADELCELLIADRDVYLESGGGVTFSGGEPLLQPEFVCAVAARMRAAGVHTAIETALNVPWADVARVCAQMDLVYADLKCVGAEAHRAGTGAGNERILENIKGLSAGGARMILRTPVVPGFNADEGEMERIADFVAALPGRHPVELLAYHSMCAPKYAALGLDFPCAGTAEPDEGMMARFAGILRARGIDCKYVM